MIIKNVKNLVRRTANYTKLHYQDWKAGKELSIQKDNLSKISKKDIILVCCLRNESFRIEYFYKYYKKLGVDHFIFIDNGSTDNFSEWASNKSDVSSFYTEGSYKDSRFGMLWCNDILRRYGTGHWCLVVDPDEFLVFPHIETRSLRALVQHLDEEGKNSMHAIMIDAYSNMPLSKTRLLPGENPFDLCPYFDCDGYIQSEAWYGGTWIRGGPRLREQFFDRPAEAPALNKIPLVKWQQYYHYNMSTHDARPLSLNQPHLQTHVTVTGALFHFKMIASLKDKAEEEMKRREHFSDGREYERYLQNIEANYFKEGLSLQYLNSEQLVEEGLISIGNWF